jgi:hypothetical protein
MIFNDERFRKCSNHPAALRQRMIERGTGIEPENDQASDDYDILTALHRMSDDDDRWAAMQLLPDADCERVVALIPVWQALQELPDSEIERLFDEMNDDD